MEISDIFQEQIDDEYSFQNMILGGKFMTIELSDARRGTARLSCGSIN